MVKIICTTKEFYEGEYTAALNRIGDKFSVTVAYTDGEAKKCCNVKFQNIEKAVEAYTDQVRCIAAGAFSNAERMLRLKKMK